MGLIKLPKVYKYYYFQEAESHTENGNPKKNDYEFPFQGNVKILESSYHKFSFREKVYE